MTYVVTGPAKQVYRVLWRTPLGGQTRSKKFPATSRGLRGAFALQRRLPLGASSEMQLLTLPGSVPLPSDDTVEESA
jgi:hypothetical protein